jgi:shikimate dehydrogenase
MRQYGLIGYPLGHSFSQEYFERKFAAENIAGCEYKNFPLPNLKNLPELVHNNPSLCGLNVTIPHKTGILKFINVLDPVVREVGSANVLKIRRSGSNIEIFGYNSDIYGIEVSLGMYLTSGIKIGLILGTGGSSRAVRYVLEKHGIDAIFISRNRRQGVLNYKDLTPEIILGSRLIINTTPLGMFPDTGSKPDIDYNLLNREHILFDLVYNPDPTLFLKTGQERGCITISGIKMLYAQAEKSWEIWNDDSF